MKMAPAADLAAEVASDAAEAARGKGGAAITIGIEREGHPGHRCRWQLLVDHQRRRKHRPRESCQEINAPRELLRFMSFVTDVVR